MISSHHLRLSRHGPIFSSSLKQMTTAEIPGLLDMAATSSVSWAEFIDPAISQQARGL
jgi:hypothetical protein